MKVLKLTVLLDNTVSKAQLMNIFGACIMLGRRLRFVQFTFPSIRMLTSIQLKPIHDLIKSYEDSYGTLKFKMFHLYDDNENTFSPFAIHCLRGKWYTVSTASLEEGKAVDSLFNLL